MFVAVVTHDGSIYQKHIVRGAMNDWVSEWIPQIEVFERREDAVEWVRGMMMDAVDRYVNHLSEEVQDTVQMFAHVVRNAYKFLDEEQMLAYRAILPWGCAPNFAILETLGVECELPF